MQWVGRVIPNPGDQNQKADEFGTDWRRKKKAAPRGSSGRWAVQDLGGPISGRGNRRMKFRAGSIQALQSLTVQKWFDQCHRETLFPRCCRLVCRSGKASHQHAGFQYNAIREMGSFTV